MRAAYQLRRVRAISLGVSLALPRFVPVSASGLAHAVAHAEADVAFLGDVQLAPDLHGGLALVHAPGCALAGGLTAQPIAVPPAPAARAVQADGTLVDVGLEQPLDAELTSAPIGVFVYGTLMRGEEREAAVRSVLPDATPADGRATGGLVHLGAWPGMVSGAGVVHGELFHTNELAPLLAVLDPIEDFLGFDVAPTEYVRVVLPVTTATGVAWAWTYRYVGDLGGSVAIPSGRWRDVPRRLPGSSGMRRPTDAV